MNAILGERVAKAVASSAVFQQHMWAAYTGGAMRPLEQVVGAMRLHANFMHAILKIQEECQ